MWDAFFARRNFYNKCKSALRMINMRLEIIAKKRSAMEKFLKNDVADLLRSNLDHNAYGRAQGLYMEMNLSWCYNYIQECCTLIADNLKTMQTETECPEECRVAVASLAYAAARVADLPELRDLRSLFNDKYGNVLESYVNKELVEKLKANPPTREAKLELMKDIAKEFSVSWDHASFDQNMQDGSTKGYNVQQRTGYEHAPSNNTSGYREDGSTKGYNVQQRMGYERAPSNNTSGYREVYQTRPYTNNVVPSPYVKLKNTNGSDREEGDEETVRDRLLKHESMKTWREITRGGRADSSSGTYGRSVSLYANNHMHPKLPEYDELASRIQALRKM